VRYEIRVDGVLDAQWSCWFNGLDITTEAGSVTIISGLVVDRAAVHGLLARIRALG